MPYVIASFDQLSVPKHKSMFTIRQTLYSGSQGSFKRLVQETLRLPRCEVRDSDTKCVKEVETCWGVINQIIIRRCCVLDKYKERRAYYLYQNRGAANYGNTNIQRVVPRKSRNPGDQTTTEL